MKLQVLVEIEVTDLKDAVGKLNTLKDLGMEKWGINVIGPHQVLD